MKHTKGNWEFEQTEKVESGLDIIIKSGNNIIGWIYRSSEMDKDEDLANAKLIAAAPELLEVCKLAMKSEIDGSYVLANNWWGVMREAIQKATQ